MTEEESLRKEINSLKKELDNKDNEIIGYIDKIEILEDELMKLQELMSEKPSKKKSKKLIESKFLIELEAKDREIRELKNKMGFLRKDKLQAEKKLDNIKLENKSSSVIRVEDLRKKAPLNILVKELQDKINKQESLIRRFRSQKGGSNDYIVILQDKDNEIESLKTQLSELNQKLEKSESISETKINISPMDTNSNLPKSLLEELQNKLNKFKRETTELRDKLDIYKNKDKFDKKVKEYESKISELKKELKNREKTNRQLREESIIIDDSTKPTALKQVVEELKNKLNKSKSQVSILQEQLKALGNQNAVNKTIPQEDIDNKLKIQREMASFLQQQLDEAKNALKTKNEEVAFIKEEAIRIKRSREELERQLRLKDNKIAELMNNIDDLNIVAGTHVQTQQVENPQLLLRIEELKNIIEDLTKQNIQQRLEIDQLRKSI